MVTCKCRKEKHVNSYFFKGRVQPTYIHHVYLLQYTSVRCLAWDTYYYYYFKILKLNKKD